MRGLKVIYGTYIENICEKYLCGLKIVYELVWVYIFVSELMKLGFKILYLNKSKKKSALKKKQKKKKTNKQINKQTKF